MGFSIDYQFISNTNPVFNNFMSSYGSAIIHASTPTTIYENTTETQKYVQSVNLTIPTLPNGQKIRLAKKGTTMTSALSVIVYNQEISNTNSSLSNGGVILMPTEELMIQIIGGASDYAVNYNANTIEIAEE
jgi:superfamily II DNA/RNA helicase